MFATGIENSIPTINNGRTRVDQMEACGHYERWREDFDCVQEIGIQFLRYGPPLHRTFLGPGKYDWEFADITFADLQAARHHPDRRPVPFRRARLDRQFPEPGFPAAVRALCRRVRRALSRGSSSTRRSTRCSSARSSRPNMAGGTSS